MSTGPELCPKPNPTHHIPLVSAPPQVEFVLPAHPPAPTASPPRAVVPLGMWAATARFTQELSAEVEPAVATMR